ncbi:MAG: CDP-alcohol phosphatidyltransferase family protein [Planctomycetaceae bacterium]|nr:CDP-alcohol phosphatidyltransferase family protein [Planctomycetaceae bacterium]
MKPRLIAVVPTLLTLGNAACGFGAITFAAKLGPADLTVPAGDSLFASNPSLVAALLVFLGMLFDMLDGSVARLTKQTSELGAQLDSLCDAITFGTAPAFLMLQFVSRELAGGAGFSFHPRMLWTIAALYAVCAILRLARFNVETDEDDSHAEFSGLPSPAAAGAVVAFPFAMPTLKELADGGDTLTATVAQWLIPAIKTGLPLVTLAVACLMVSRIRYPHFFSQLIGDRRSRRHVIQLVFGMAVIFWVHELAVPLIFCYFAFASPLKAVWMETLGRRLTPPRNTPSPSAKG